MADKIKRDIEALTSWRESSPNGKVSANVVVAGLLGSGKSALVNALFGEHVAKEKQSQSQKVRKGEVHILNYYSTYRKIWGSSSVKIWDTCGLLNSDSEDESTLKAIKSIPCINGKKQFTLLYTIAINKVCTGEDCSDLECMLKLKDYFNNAAIVFTFANEDISELKDENDRKRKYQENLHKWESTLREHLKNKIVTATDAQKIPIIPAGYLIESSKTEALNYGCKGKSWVQDVWQGIAEAAPMQDKPLLLDICINKFYSASFAYCDSYLSLIELYLKSYKEKLNLPLSSAYALLHLLLFWLDNKTLRRVTPCETGSIEYWTSLTPSVEAVVTGEKDSGKTSIINSMLLKKFDETSQRVSAEFRKVSCKFVETPLSSLNSELSENCALVILCLEFNDTEVNMKRVLQSLHTKIYRNLLIVLTSANANITGRSIDDVVKDQTSKIQSILKTLNVTTEVKVVPAGYFKKMTLTENSEPNWIINLWFAAISQAKASSQPAMVITLNYCSLHRWFFPTGSDHFKEPYMQGIIDLLLGFLKDSKKASEQN